MLVPCWFTLWTSGRFLHHYILLISIEIFLIFLCYWVRDDVLHLLQESGGHQESLDSLLLHVKPSLSLQWVRGELHCLVVLLDQKPLVMTY